MAYGLFPEALKAAQRAIDTAEGGVLEVSEILGENWDKISSGPAFGIRFARSVARRELRGVRLVGRKSNNHLIYEISQGR